MAGPKACVERMESWEEDDMNAPPANLTVEIRLCKSRAIDTRSAYLTLYHRFLESMTVAEAENFAQEEKERLRQA